MWELDPKSDVRQYTAVVAVVSSSRVAYERNTRSGLPTAADGLLLR